MMKKWYVIYTKSRKEKIALQNLRAQGYDAHLPLVKLEKIIRHKKVIIEEPLFARYLFIRLDEHAAQGWSPIRSTIGVSQMVRFGNLLAQLSDEDMEMILNLHAQPVTQTISSGDSVIISDGPFKGVEALFSHFDGDQRAVLLLNLLEKKVKGKFNLSEFSLIK
jgi:transcriptional antiterminator RfaH